MTLIFCMVVMAPVVLTALCYVWGERFKSGDCDALLGPLTGILLHHGIAEKPQWPAWEDCCTRLLSWRSLQPSINAKRARAAARGT